MHVDPREETQFRDNFNKIMNDDPENSSWGYPAQNVELDADAIHKDLELERVVKELLHNSHRLDARDITVNVSKCDVRLSGTVKNQMDRDYAVGIVKLVHGVKEVESDLIVKTHDGILPTDIGRN